MPNEVDAGQHLAQITLNTVAHGAVALHVAIEESSVTRLTPFVIGVGKANEITGQRESPTSSNEFEDDLSPDTRLPPILDEDEPGSAGGSQQSSQSIKSLRRMNTASSLNMNRLIMRTREISETPSQDEMRSASSTLSGNTAFDAAPTTASTPDPTLEEYFGDYTNLMGHQKAALEILTQLFNPQSILQTTTGRLILAWYTRFDLLVASLGILRTSLPRHWIEANDTYCQMRAFEEADNMQWIFEKTESQLGLISVDMCLLVSQRKTGDLTEDMFRIEQRNVAKRLLEWRETLHPVLTDPAHLVKTFAPASPVSQSKLFSYSTDHVPLYDGPLCFTTALICEWHSMVLMHLCQATEDITVKEPSILGDTAEHAMAICELIEAAGQWPTFPKDLLTMLHPTLIMAAMFLPRSTRHHMWLKEQFAGLESCGYVFPLTVRKRMAHLFQDETAVRWWLPNDQGFSPILQSVRAFADERSYSPSSEQEGRHVQDMKHTFDALVGLRLQDPKMDSPESED
ncbi:hypothetical protein N0V93_007740 [Gnomoniopsis smithogilvyi]|uniref:Uncharacterized protein n=1 Tax=Gnomoniopsis smithogilvyi TaxID=1191159 RepID=A0A9W9CT87_9PEZI|nr:hypothetical protein N0V93_007740 [Gnomoniopsis smithogilvyi]